MSTAIDPFVAALERTLRVLAGTVMTRGAVESCESATITADVSAQITVRGDEKFLLVLTATEAAAHELVRSVAGIETSLEDGLTADTLGEVLNVVVGSAQKGGGPQQKFQFSIPVIETARGHTLTVFGKRSYQRVVSKTPMGELSLYLIEDVMAST